MFKQNRLPVFAAVFLLCLLLVGCGSTSSVTEEVYTLYFANTARNTHTTESRPKAQFSENLQEAAYNLMEAMRSPEQVGNVSLFAVDGIEYRVRMEQDSRIMSIYFNDAYSKLSAAQEVLLRAGIVRTLTQLPGVDNLSFYLNEQPMTDATGRLIGVMSINSFLDSRGENLSNYEQVVLSLYYGSEDGTALVKAEREMTISSSISQERQLINALLAGPDREGLMATLPTGTTLISVSVKNRICYVNFSGSFLTGNLSVDPSIAIYSLVNSLTELSTISTVQIMVDGDSSVQFHETIGLDAPFERNLDYVNGGK